MAARDLDTGVWAVVGVSGAITLGMALVPFRSVTAASNLAFVFLILTIVVAELGGRTAGLATAIVSALSLNFFLTAPYLTLTIDKPDDLFAFAALAVSGLVAAAFGRRRARSADLVTGTRRDLAALERFGRGLAEAQPLAAALDEVRRSFALGGLVLRHADERLVAAAPAQYASRPAPAVQLEPDTLLATDGRAHRLGRRGFRLPDGGGRVRLGAEGASLDLWEGDAEGLPIDDLRALTVAITMLGLSLQRGATLRGEMA